MTFLSKLKAHVHGLIRIKTQLYWYNTDKWDGAHESVHLLLDVLDPAKAGPGDISPAGATLDPIGAGRWPEAVLLFIDGAPKWIWVYSGAVELIK